MDFQVGEQVVHWSYGPGEIIELEEKELAGHKAMYYVVQVRDLTIWVPKDDAANQSLRRPTPASEFEHLFTILRGPGEPLSSDRLERKRQLSEQMKDGSLDSVCRVIRDLWYYRQNKKLSDSDATILERAQSFLLSEWKVSLSVPGSQAERELKQLLGERVAPQP